jgi:hypothetical protein
MIGTMFISASQGIVLIRIIALIDYYTYYNVATPANLQSFLEIFSTSVVKMVPNPLLPLTNNDCPPLGLKFEQ